MQGYTDKYTPQVGEGHISILPWHYSAITSGTWSWGGASGHIYYGYWYNTPGDDHDQIDYKVYLAAGTYTTVILYAQDSDCGVLDFLLGGVSKGTFDTYGTAANNKLGTVSGWTVSTPGIKIISIKCTGKHASSTDYLLKVCTISLYRTA
jgi:hypothetical protein